MHRRLLFALAIVAVFIAVGAGVRLLPGSISSTAAQEPTPAFGTLTGMATRLVERIIVDGVIVDEIEVPVTDGRIAIPELGIDLPLGADGSFSFSDLPVSADPDNPTEVTVIFTAPGLGSYTYEHLRLYPGTVGSRLTPLMTGTPRVNDRGRAHPERDRAQMDVSGDLPQAGGGGPVAGSGPPVASWLLVLLGAALVCAGAGTRLIRRSRR